MVGRVVRATTIWISTLAVVGCGDEPSDALSGEVQIELTTDGGGVQFLLRNPRDPSLLSTESYGLPGACSGLEEAVWNCLGIDPFGLMGPALIDSCRDPVLALRTCYIDHASRALGRFLVHFRNDYRCQLASISTGYEALSNWVEISRCCSGCEAGFSEVEEYDPFAEDCFEDCQTAFARLYECHIANPCWRD